MSSLEDEIGDIIAKARIGIGRTTAQLAEATHVSVRDIESIENYKLHPAPELVDRLAKALSLDPIKLTGIAEDGWKPDPVDMSRDGFTVERVEVPYGEYAENCYVIELAESGIAAVVDPGGVSDQIVQLLADRQLKLEMILVTHAHPDHIAGLRQLISAWPKARIVNHQLERDSVTRGGSVTWEPAKDGVNIRLGSLSMLPLHIPGHTPGSMCYLIDGLCFVGDNLFAGSIGRPAGPTVYPQMLKALRDKVLSLPDATILLPGHGPATTVGEEKTHNPFF
ncbi:MAG: MBL fold metallo-hydrolase [Armatimonadota bacterium]